MEKENKKYLILGFLYLALAAVTIFLIFKFGVAATVKISELIQGSSSESSSNLSDVIIPSPQLSSIPQATNSAELNIWGFAPANFDIDLFLNDSHLKSTTANSEGKFDTSIVLSLGINKIFATTKNKEGVSSSPSPTWTIFYSDTPPVLEITEPTSDTVILKTKETVIKGKIEKTSKLTINDRLVIVDSEGVFNYAVVLQKGENKFQLVCTDPAQHKSVRELIFQLQ